jgi:hypothetical protein
MPELAPVITTVAGMLRLVIVARRMERARREKAFRKIWRERANERPTRCGER